MMFRATPWSRMSFMPQQVPNRRINHTQSGERGPPLDRSQSHTKLCTHSGILGQLQAPLVGAIFVLGNTNLSC